MITSGIYNYVNILDKAADAANLRNELLTNNIANVSTPNYKRKDLDFESVLQGELAGEKNLSKAVKKANQNLETLDAQVYTDNASLSYLPKSIYDTFLPRYSNSRSLLLIFARTCNP